MKRPRKKTTGDKRKKSGHSQIATRFQMERLFRIVAEIQKGEYPNCATLAKIHDFELNRRTILRDIDCLRRLGAPLEYSAARNGYYFTADFHLMPPLDLKNEDFLTLYFLQQCLAPYEDTEIGGHMKKSFERMFGLLTGTQAWKKWDAAVAFRGEPKTVAAGDQLKTFEVLFSAINAKQVVRFEYHGRGKEASKREVEPSLVVMNKGRWYLYGVDRKVKGVRTFALGRIRKISNTREEFPPRPPLLPRELFRHSFGIVVEEKEPREVVIDFTPGAADLIRESVWHPNQKLEPLPDGRVRFRLFLTSFYEIKPWIQSWGHYARVIEPPELVEEIQCAITAAVDVYSGKT
jgi:predicted DNA-binding transcriptional regulator YafY